MPPDSSKTVYDQIAEQLIGMHPLPLVMQAMVHEPKTKAQAFSDLLTEEILLMSGTKMTLNSA